VENAKDVDHVFVTNQVRDTVVTVEQNADVLVGILFVAMPRFRELAQDLDAVIDAENNLPCGFFVVAGDVVVDLLEPVLCLLSTLFPPLIHLPPHFVIADGTASF
jgi:hypothetical protein